MVETQAQLCSTGHASLLGYNHGNPRPLLCKRDKTGLSILLLTLETIPTILLDFFLLQQQPTQVTQLTNSRRLTSSSSSVCA